MYASETMQVETVHADKNLYLLLGEIKAKLEGIEKTTREADRVREEQRVRTDERITRMEKKINYAAGAVAFSVFLFQAIWAYITKKV